ncbi:hypothetical protein CFK39_09420 [Brachybacterium avium]|uniref:DUF4878 domain-containing protein n=1 Tax=Brachybacterium avium TaxID=2017485 RepID=A0A220UDH3_9MICO|nr:hypothetical protein [Brachybacterium avium]ASK66001.1 hypothetical protein CFK39_09420 [Brachybacterium avium]
MVRGQEQSTGRTIRTGWTETDDPRTALTTPDAPARHRGPGARRIAGALTVLALVAVAMPWLLLRGQDPEEVARAYLDALIAGDLSTVREHLVPIESAVDEALTEPLREATPGRIAGYTIEEVVVRGVVATVRVTLRNAREEHAAVLTLSAVPDGPLRALRWELEPVPLPLLTLGPRASTGVVLLNGQRIEIPAVHWTGRRTDRPSVALHVLPGRYTVELPATGPHLVPRTAEVYVPPVLGHWQTGLITVDYRPSRDGLSRARTVILEELAQCLLSGVARPPGCPLGADLPADTPGSWLLLELPEISYGEMVGDSFDYRGEGLVAEFITAQGGDAHGGAQSGELPAPGPRVHRMSVDFGVTLRQDGTGLEVQHWAFTTLRPWPR